ncbi:DNA polymerase III subunit chi [Thiomicrorhabdus sp. 6S3-12]|uniref:DNA polymerase III subunit chi n=1 Tax=Thiomicrorhabdus sp. 6S3-12 TaxID=2819681 RepID=UPI001AAD912E|nr:DNA polymerase III subunit chi [Thiomicrorhabdus sp. 6S3-12]MBO1923037.1 DNA polymerase III subunit chi [Thiomicrorhabdus sp. 6S3-12]
MSEDHQKTPQENVENEAARDVLFYILNSTDQQSRDRFLCQLLNKIYRQGRQCDVRFASEQDARRFELTLWNWKATSFIPHSVMHEMAAPIQLFGERLSKKSKDVLINLHPDFCEDYSDYQRTIEIVDQSEFLVQKGRVRWKDYQQRQLTPTVHKIGFD